ncbi:MAG TPA: mycofactocin precursor MftA [Streptosporangiaceae bacterium]|jgi:mycofactocin precursor
MAESATELLDPPADQRLVAAEAAGRHEVADIQPDQVIAADLLVEEISIDGMCGVY